MKLADWLKIPKADGTKKKRFEFAARLHVTPQTITGLCKGTFYPSMKLAQRIYELTDGQVTPTDFIETDLRGAA